MRFQFTLRRLLLGTTMFALVLGIAGKLGGGSIAWVLLASTGFAALVILVRRQDITRLIYSFVFTGIGLFVADIMFPYLTLPPSFLISAIALAWSTLGSVAQQRRGANDRPNSIGSMIRFIELSFINAESQK